MIFASKNRHYIRFLQPLKSHKTPNFPGGFAPGHLPGPQDGPLDPTRYTLRSLCSLRCHDQKGRLNISATAGLRTQSVPGCDIYSLRLFLSLFFFFFFFFINSNQIIATRKNRLAYKYVVDNYCSIT